MSQDLKVVVTDQVFPSIDTETQLLAAIGARIEVADGTADGVARLGGDADALLNTYLPITDQLLGQLPACKIVARYGIGTDNVDVAAAARRGVVVTNVPDYSVEEVALHALCLMLALTRRLPEASGWSRGAAGGWTGCGRSGGCPPSGPAWSGSAGSPVAWRATSPRSAAGWWRTIPSSGRGRACRRCWRCPTC